MNDYELMKRVYDFSISVIILFFSIPIFILISLLIKLTSEGNIFIKQTRVGKNRKKFLMYKFRTMYKDADPSVHKEYVRRVVLRKEKRKNLYKLADDQRITSVGKILRKYSIDELAQFINVIKGEMSIVGPRPAIPYELDFYKDSFYLRFNAKPGITGYWQVSGRNKWDFETMIELDLKYIKQKNMIFDIIILIKTPFSMFFEKYTA